MKDKTKATDASPGHSAETQQATDQNDEKRKPSTVSAPSIASGGVEDSGGGSESNRGCRVEFVKVRDLKPHPLSKRIYGDAVPPALRDSIEDGEIQTPLIVSRKSGYVLSGNSRLAAAKELKWELVPVIYREGELPPEVEDEIVITSNAGRIKTRAMKALEYRELKRIEIALAKLRKSKGLERTDSGPDLDPTDKSRQKAAKRVGESASTMDKGLKVIEAVEKLESEGKADEAVALLAVLNDGSYDAAFKKAQEKEIIPATKKKEAKALAAGSKNAQADEGEVTRGVLKPTDIEDGGDGEPAENVDSGLAPTSSNAVEAHGPVIKTDASDQDVAAVAIEAGDHLDAVVTILRSKVVTRLSKAQKDDLGEYIGKVNRFAALAGIKVLAA